MDVAALDPGIRDTVHLLASRGFTTTDSGDGVSKPADERVFDCPHVAAVTTRDVFLSEADRMQRVLGAEWRVEASYCAADGSCILLAMKQ